MDSISKERYTRQISLQEVGERGQVALSNSSVLIVGVGGLGSPISTLLVSAGFGRVGIVDYDVVSMSNLPRQTLYTTDDIGLPKVECAAKRLKAMNPNVTIESYKLKFDESVAVEILSKYDMVVDGCDNAASRYIIDNAAKQLNKPYIYGAINGFLGQVSLFHYNGVGGYSELFPKQESAAPSAPPAVMATTPAIIGAIEANEAIKIAIGGYGNTLQGKLLTLDLRDYSFNLFEL